MSESIATIPANIAQSSPYLIIVSVLLSLLVSQGSVKWPLYFLCFYIVFGEIGNFLTKRLFRHVFPTEQLFLRPSPPSTGCGVFSDCGAGGSRTYGFPSGHAQLTSLAAMFWSLYVYYQTSLSTTQKIIRISIMWVLAGLVWYSRVHIGCHNWIQISGGVVMGSLFGFLAFYIVKKIKTD
jgi:membrane-associated phospholipid phosphatase